MKNKIYLICLLISQTLIVTQVSAQIPSYVPTNNLVGWWPFNGNANDLSGNGNNGTVNGAIPSADRFGVALNAFSFDGVNDNMDIGNLNLGISNQSFSISIWFKTIASPSGYGYMISDYSSNIGSDNIFAFHLGQALNNGTIYLDKQNMPSYFFQAQTSASLGQWNHMVIVSNASNGIVEFYCNGNFISQLLVNSSSINNQLTIPYYNANNNYSIGQFFRFGCHKWNGVLQEFYKGNLDDIGIWNRALTQQEITNLYQGLAAPQSTITTPTPSICAGQSATLSATVNNLGTPCATAGLPPTLNNGLLGYWPFCGNANDASGNGNNGTVNGPTLTADRFGNASSAYSFDGVNDFIESSVSNVPLLNSARTISLWMNFTPLHNDWNTLVSYGNGVGVANADKLYDFFIKNNTQQAYINNNELGNLSGTLSNTVGNWCNLIISYNGTNINNGYQLYINGVNQSLTPFNYTNLTSLATTISNVFFGRTSMSYSGQYFYYSGKLDDIGIWNRVLTQQEISQLYQLGQAAYLWSNGATSPNITVSLTQTTTYTCTVTMNGATSTQSQTVTVNAFPTVSAGSNQTVCAGTSITLNGSGANSYSWNNGVQNGVAFIPTTSQTFTVTGTDVNGCVNTAQSTVSVNALPTVGAGSNQTVCAGTSITLNGSGANSYTWNNGVQNGVAFIPTTSQTFTVTGTDINACSNTAQVLVTVNPLPTISAGSNQTVCAGTSISLNGSGANSYSWNNGVQNGVAFIPTISQTFTVTGTNVNGCVNTAQSTVSVNALPTVGAGSNQTVCAGTPITLNGSGANSYSWNYGVQNGVAFIPTISQTFTVTGTDVNGCVNTAQSTVSVNALPTVSAGSNQTVCAGTSITLNGSGANSYSWNNGVQNGVTFIPATSQTFTVIGTDVNGCVNTAQATVSVNALPTVGAGSNQTVCAGTSITLNGSGANSYNWNNGVQNGVAFIPMTTQTYTVTGTDVNACSNTAQVLVSVNPLPTVSAGSNQTVCAGTSITLNGSGANSYSWNNGVQNGVAFIPNATQTFTVTGIDTNGCQNIDSVNVTVNQPTFSSINETACDSFSLNGQTYTQNGTYVQNLNNALGCDSTLTLTLTMDYSPFMPVITVFNDINLFTNQQNGTNFQWLNCGSGLAINGATDTSYTVTLNGQYAVEVSNNCGSIISECVTIDNISTSSIDFETIVIYPNPTFDFLNIEGLKQNSTDYELWDNQGRIIRQDALNSKVSVIDLRILPNGIYFLEIEESTFRIIKQ